MSRSSQAQDESFEASFWPLKNSLYFQKKSYFSALIVNDYGNGDRFLCDSFTKDRRLIKLNT